MNWVATTIRMALRRQEETKAGYSMVGEVTNVLNARRKAPSCDCVDSESDQSCEQETEQLQNHGSSSLEILELETMEDDTFQLLHQQQQQQQQQRLSVILFSICVVLLFADQNLMAPNLTAIANEFEFSDDQRDRKLGGDISLAFYLVGAPAAIFIGCLADQPTFNRISLLSWTVGLGEGACILTYTASSYWQLYTCRAITGISIAGALPIIYSILGDLFEAKDRVAVCAMVSFGTGAGVAIGQAIAGFFGPIFGWRLPFLIVGLPALCSAIIIRLVVQDPQRGSAEPMAIQHSRCQQYENRPLTIYSQEPTAPYPNGHQKHQRRSPSLETGIIKRLQREKYEAADRYQRITTATNDPLADSDTYHDNLNESGTSSLVSLFWGDDWTLLIRSTLQLLSTRSILLGMIQGLPGCIPWGIVSAFLNDYLSEDRGYSIPAATTILMFFSLGHALGLTLGAWAGRRLYEQNHRYPQLFSGSMAASGCIPFWILLNFVDAASTPYWFVCTLATVWGVFTGPTGPIVKSTLVNVTLPELRGQAFAMCILFDDFGKGLGPFFVSLLIVNLGGRRPAFNVGVLGWLVCGILNTLLYFTVQQDEAEVQLQRKEQQENGKLQQESFHSCPRERPQEFLEVT